MSIKNNLAKAEALYHNGEFEQAIIICQKVLNKKPKLFNAMQIIAACNQGLGRLDLALSIFKQLIVLNDKHAPSYNNIGNIYLAQKNHTEASKFYLKAQRINPQMAEVSNNLAICQQKLGNFVTAEANYKKAIMLDGKVADFHYNLGVLFSDLGYFKLAAKSLLKSLELNQNKTTVYWHVVKVFMYQHRYQDALEVIDMGLLSNTLSEMELCELLVGKAMLFWLFYNPEGVEQAIALSESIYRFENNSDNINNMIIFHRYIKKLLSVRQQQPYLYWQGVVEQESIQPIYFISESHGFSPNDTLVQYQGQQHYIRSLFIFGAKIFHLASENDNRYKASLDLLLSGLPSGSNVIMGFGEIDCRSTEGIFRHCNKHQLNVHSEIERLLSQYIMMLKQKEEEYGINIIVYGVPAPHPFHVKKLSTEQQEQFKKLIAYFNFFLADVCEQKGILFLDVYQLTQLDGSSNLKYHTDDIHLKAETVPELFTLLTK